MWHCVATLRNCRPCRPVKLHVKSLQCTAMPPRSPVAGTSAYLRVLKVSFRLKTLPSLTAVFCGARQPDSASVRIHPVWARPRSVRSSRPPSATRSSSGLRASRDYLQELVSCRDKTDNGVCVGLVSQSPESLRNGAPQAFICRPQAAWIHISHTSPSRVSQQMAESNTCTCTRES